MKASTHCLVERSKEEDAGKEKSCGRVEKWLLRALICEQGEHPLVAKRDAPQFLHSYTDVSLVCPWETCLVGRFQLMACFG